MTHYKQYLDILQGQHPAEQDAYLHVMMLEPTEGFTVAQGAIGDAYAAALQQHQELSPELAFWKDALFPGGRAIPVPEPSRSKEDPNYFYLMQTMFDYGSHTPDALSAIADSLAAQAGSPLANFVPIYDQRAYLGGIASDFAYQLATCWMNSDDRVLTQQELEVSFYAPFNESGYTPRPATGNQFIGVVGYDEHMVIPPYLVDPALGIGTKKIPGSDVAGFDTYL